MAPIMKWDKFSLDPCPKNSLENEKKKSTPYALVVGSLMYTQVCTRPNIGFAIEMFGKY